MFRENLPIIRIGVLSNVQHGLAATAYAQGLISERVHRTVTDALSRLTADERTDIFLNELKLQIHNDTNFAVLPKFVDMLKQADPLHYTSIIRAISKSTVRHFCACIIIPFTFQLWALTCVSLSSSHSAEALELLWALYLLHQLCAGRAAVTVACCPVPGLPLWCSIIVSHNNM